MNPKVPTVVPMVLLAGQPSWGQGRPSRYTIDDVVAKLDGLGKRLRELEVRFARLEAKMDDREKRFVETLRSTRTTIFWGFGIFTLLYSLILGIVLGIYREVKPTARARANLDAALMMEQVRSC